MQTTMCPFCMRAATGAICSHCGRDVHYPGHANHLPVGYTLQGQHAYILGAAIGQGGFGITYIAMDAQTNQRVAIKEYFPTHCCGRSSMTEICSNLGQEETFIRGKEHFLQEAQMLRSLSDLNSVVCVLDFFKANNSAYLVMEYLDGLSLKDYVEKNGKFPAQKFLSQLKPLMADMEKMHRRGVVHRDIAPDNIIMLPDGQLKMIDFGAARSYVGDKSMTVVVKKGFAPVEQYMRKGSNASTDVYALAATIYYCVTGIVPPDSAERQYGEAVMVAPSALGVELQPDQEYALEKALELQPKDRIQTIAGLEELLFIKKTDSQKENRVKSGASLDNQKINTSARAEKNKVRSEKPVRREKENLISQEKQKLILLKTVKGVVAVSAAAAVLYAGSWGIKCVQYASAEKAMQNGDFEKAYSIFASLKEFRDSAEQVAYCRKEADYAAAKSLFEAERYHEAAEAFNALGGYADSVSWMQESEYLYGRMLLESGEYGQAYEVFGLLKAYKDSADYADQAGYLYADALSKEKKYHEAYLLYSQIADYKDSMALGQEAEYQYAVMCVDNKLYPEGISAFDRLENYRDAAQKSQETRFAYAEELTETAQWKQASELYLELKDYKDSEERYVDTRYRYACQRMEEQAYVDAVQEFEQLGKYEKSADYLLEAKYKYASGHLDRTDAVTAEYLDDLRVIPYEDAQVLYDSLFDWKVTLTAVNMDEGDGTTKLDAVPMHTDYLHFRFLLEGGKPQETIDVSYNIVWPTGAQKNGKSEWKDAASGYYLDCSWNNGLYEKPEKGRTGVMKVQVYNKANGKLLGEGAVSLTD